MSTSSLYGNTSTVTSNDTTSLYGASSNAQVPNSNGDLLVKGNLAVDGGNITTTAATATVFNTNATTLSIGGAATSLNLGASTGSTAINNNLIVGGTINANGNITAPGGTFGNITVAVADDNTITTTTGDLRISPSTSAISLPAAGVIKWPENSNRTNRLNFKASNGTTSGIRTLPPVATGGIATTSVITTNDINNSQFVNISANEAATNPLRIQTGKYTAGVLGASGTSLAFIDNVTTYATVNPAGPTIGSDLTTKSYVDTQLASGVTSITGTANQVIASSPTGAVTLSLPQSIATTSNPVFAGATLGSVKVGVTTDNTIDTTSGGLTIAPATGVITVSAPTTVTWAEAGDRTKRLTFKSSSGNSTGVRTLAPNTSGSALAQIGAFSSSDIDNGSFINLRANNSGTDPLRIFTGTYTSGVLGASSGAAFVDNATTYATVNPSGPTNALDLITKQYFESNIPVGNELVNGLYTVTLNADGTVSFPTYTFPEADGGVNQILQTDGSGVLSWVTPNAANALVNGSYNLTLNADGSLTTDVSPVNLYSTAGITNQKSSLLLSGNTAAITAHKTGVGTDPTASVTANGVTGVVDINTSNPLTSTNYNWIFNADGTTSFPAYTFPAADGTSNQVLKTNGSGILSWYTPVDTNTTYTYTAGSTSGGANLTLTGSDASVNTVKVASGTGITVAQNSSTQITVTNSGVTSLAAGTYLSVNASTGAVTVSTNATSANTASTIVARDASGNFSAGTITANTSNGNYVLGQEYFTRNSSWTPPANALTTLDGNNGIAIGSSSGTNGYSPQLQLVYASGDTTAGTNAAPAVQTRASAGTTASPSAIATNQVAGTWNIDGWATTGWASTIATTGSGAGTTSIQPLQVQAYAVSAFTDSAGTVTNAPMGFRVRGFAASTNLSTANRTNFIDHQYATATYKATTFNIQAAASTTNYASFVASGATFTAASGNGLFIRQDTNNTTQPVLVLRHQRTDTTGANDGDGTDFRLGVGGTSTNTNIGRFDAVYKASTLHEIGMSTSTDSFAANTNRVYIATADTTKIQCTPAATPSGSLVTVAQFTQAATTLKTNAVTLQTAAGVNLVGNAVTYNRVYGQWQYDTTVTPAAANTAYVFPIGTADFNNIATVGSTSRIIPGAAGMYKLQFSVQINNADNGSDHIAYIWWRKNGVDVAASMGQVTIPKAGATIAGWDNMISSANTTDYWELAYAVSDTALTFPFYASTAFGPSTACLFTTLVPIGV